MIERPFIFCLLFLKEEEEGSDEENFDLFLVRI